MPKNRNISYSKAAVYLIHIIQPHKKYYIFASLLAVVSMVIGLLNTKVTQLLIDNVVAKNMNLTLLHIFSFAVIITLDYIIARLSGINITTLAAKASHDMKTNVTSAIINADYSDIINLQAGDMLSTVNSDTKIISEFLGGDLIGLFAQAVMLVGAVGYLLFTDPLLMLITFAYTPLGMFFTLTLNGKMQKLYPIRADQSGEALSAIEQALTQIPVIKSFMMEKIIHKRVKVNCDTVYKTDMKISSYNAPLQTACQSTSCIPRILFFLYAGALVMRGNMTLGAFVAILDLLNFIIGPSVYFPFMLNSLNRAVASINRVKRLEELSQEEICHHVVNNQIPEIHIENLTFGYTSDKNIITDLSFTHTGTGIIIVKGKSGSGKTSLLDLISGLLIPTNGKIITNSSVSVMTQNNYLFSASVYENIRAGRLNATDDEIQSVVIQAGITGLSLDTIVGDSGTELSGGQKQRITLARILLSDSSIWLLDEPTSALDTETERIIMTALENERSKRLIIISAHRQSLSDMADIIIDLDNIGGDAI